MKFEIASTGSAHNYTRSYYMNGRDYVISGSCDEHVVRICCVQTGRRLRDVFLEVHINNCYKTPLYKRFARYWSSCALIYSLQDGNSGNSMYVQSLRGDPFRVSVLVA